MSAANLGAMPLGVVSVALSSAAAGMQPVAVTPAPAATAAPATTANATQAATVPAAPARAVPVHTATLQHPQPHAPGTSTGAAGAVGGTVFALLFVLGLILALAWLAKRMPGIAGSSNPALRVVASLSLGPRERVVVVDVGGQQLLLGVGAGGTRALHTLDAPLPVVERPQGIAVPPFAQLLAQHFGKRS
jgi:flagellar protein FliO/FliZ